VDRRELVDGHESSRLLRYLPEIYSDHPFLGDFLNIFDAIWQPLERQIDQLHAYVDPRLAPSEFLTWLGTWLDLVLDENWPEGRRRALIRHAACLYERRGTAGGLRDYLSIYLGVLPEIREDGSENDPYRFTVVVRPDDDEARSPSSICDRCGRTIVLVRSDDADVIDVGRLRRVIEEEKPAHTTYTLQLQRRDA
jgi:phage tail-like protein